MIIKCLDSKEIDSQKWDALILNSSQGTVYALSTFLNLCERGWKAVILMNADDYVAAIPVQYKYTFLFKHAYQDPFAKELGFFSVKDVDLKVFEEMLGQAFKEYRLVSKYYFNVDNYSLLKEQSLIKQECLLHKTTYHLSLSKPYSELFAGYSTNRKRDLRRAAKYDQKVVLSQDLDSLVEIFKENTAYKISGIEEYQYNLLKQLYGKLLSEGLGELYQVLYKERVISSVFITKFRNKIIFLFGAHTQEAHDIRSSTFILDHIIQNYSGRPYIFDFEGSDDANLARYYSSFGASKVQFLEYRKNQLPFLARVVKRFRAKFLF